MDARFIFLGTGTSGGVPIIACDCRVCRSTDPRDQRTRTGAALEWIDPTGARRVVLLDTTPDLRQQALRHDLRRCDAILFTHNHADHVFGLDEVRRFNAVMKAPIDVYAEQHTMESLLRIYPYIFDKKKNVNESFVATLIAHLISPSHTGDTPNDDRFAPIELWGMRFEPVRYLHGRLPILGFRIEPVAQPGQPADDCGIFPLMYATDVSAIPPRTWQKLTGLRTLVLDALRIRHHPTHFNLDQAVDAALKIEAQQTWFVHIAHEILHAEVDEQIPERINIAYDGLTIGRDLPPDTSVGKINTKKEAWDD
ncbi:MAG TPA: MBL fold metallo-hydrolase [Phycisphaerales bacterium]|nr:MBL fold metallo-hydrolase [Phycisphaerales bacterium]